MRAVETIIIFDNKFCAGKSCATEWKIAFFVIGIFAIILAKPNVNRVVLWLVLQISCSRLTALDLDAVRLLVEPVALRCLQLLDGVGAGGQQLRLRIAVRIGGELVDCLVVGVVDGILSALQRVAAVAVGDVGVGRGLVDLNPTAEVLDELNLCGNVLIADKAELVAAMAIGNSGRGDVDIVDNLAGLDVDAVERGSVIGSHVGRLCSRAIGAGAGGGASGQVAREVAERELGGMDTPGSADPYGTAQGLRDVAGRVGGRDDGHIGNGPLRLNNDRLLDGGVEVVLLSVFGVPAEELPAIAGWRLRGAALNGCVGLAPRHGDNRVCGLAPIVRRYRDRALGLRPGAVDDGAAVHLGRVPVEVGTGLGVNPLEAQSFLGLLLREVGHRRVAVGVRVVHRVCVDRLPDGEVAGSRRQHRQRIAGKAVDGGCHGHVVRGRKGGRRVAERPGGHQAHDQNEREQRVHELREAFLCFFLHKLSPFLFEMRDKSI